MSYVIDPLDIGYGVLTPSHDEQEYADVLWRSLLPRGRAWAVDADSVMAATCRGIAKSFARTDAAGQQLLRDARPDLTTNLLEEWEATLGLPDKCLGATPSLAKRKAAVRARFSATSDATFQFFIDYAAALGYTITVTPDAPFRMGGSGMGDGLGGSEWFFVLHIASPTMDAVLQCELLAVKPAYVDIIFG